MAKMYTYPIPGAVVADIDTISCDPEFSDDHVNIKFMSRQMVKTEIMLSTEEVGDFALSLHDVLYSISKKKYNPRVFSVSSSEAEE